MVIYGQAGSPAELYFSVPVGTTISAGASALTISGTNLMLHVVSQDSSLNYVLQATPQLAPTSWGNIQTNSGAGGSTLNFSVPVTTANPQRFFRINIQ